jgi:hypothetical protein
MASSHSRRTSSSSANKVVAVQTSNKLFKIYLVDSLALLVVSKRVAARCLARNRRGPLGAFLDELKLALDDDRAVLQGIMADMGVRVNPVKNALGWGAAIAGQLKLNGSLIAYSDLSRLYELEGLCALTDLRTWLWRTLQSGQTQDVQRLIDRAERHRSELDHFRAEAGNRALMPRG